MEDLVLRCFARGYLHEVGAFVTGTNVEKAVRNINPVYPLVDKLLQVKEAIERNEG